MTYISYPDAEDFVAESNRIEGINRPPTRNEVMCTIMFVELDVIKIDDVKELVQIYAPGHLLRDKPGLNVRIGESIAPAGGPDIQPWLQSILQNLTDRDPYWTHVAYELLHPFTDGNGRSGRAIWLWQMLRRGGAPLGFLHTFYYQVLAAQDRGSK